MATELRVHGVSGAPAEDILDRPVVTRVAGDSDAAFLRPRPGYGDPTGPGGAVLEAYRWGNLTSGAASRAGWLLLLPFMLVNVALWLLPPARPLVGSVLRGLTRVFALSLTAAFTLAATGATVDLIGWQCGVQPSCTRDRIWLQPLVGPTPGRRLALTALLPLAAVGLLWLLGRQTWRRYEAFPTPRTSDGTGIGRADFWSGEGLVGRLRSVHFATALGTLDAVLLGALLPHDRGTGRWLALGWALTGVCALLLAGCLVAAWSDRLDDRDTPAAQAETAAFLLRTTGIAVTALTFGYALLPRDGWPVSGALPGYAGTVTGLSAAQVGLLIVLTATALAGRRTGAFLAGLGGPVLAATGLGVGSAFSAGLAYRIADWLDRSGVAGTDGVPAVTL